MIKSLERTFTLDRENFFDIICEFHKKKFEKVQITVTGKGIEFKSLHDPSNIDFLRLTLDTEVGDTQCKEKSGIFWVLYLKDFSRNKALGKTIQMSLLDHEEEKTILILKYDLKMPKTDSVFGTCIYSIGNSVGDRILVKHRKNGKRGVKSGIS